MAEPLNNLQKLLKAVVEPCQDIEDALWDLFVERRLENATGVHLERLGKLVGEERRTLDDATYRRHIRARIKTNRSNGTHEELLEILRLVLDEDDANIEAEPQYPASIVFRPRGVVVADALAETIVDFLLDAKMGGVRLLLEYLTAAEEETFAFARAAFLDGALAGSESEIPVGSIPSSVPQTGTAEIDIGLAVNETFTYGGRTSTKFLDVVGLSNAHDAGAAIEIYDSDQAMGDAADDDVGGDLPSVRPRAMTTSPNSHAAVFVASQEQDLFLAADPALEPAGALTIEFWGYKTDAWDNFNYVWQSPVLWARTRISGLEIGFRGSDTANAYRVHWDHSGLAVNEWHHFAIVFDPDRRVDETELFLSGALDTSLVMDSGDGSEIPGPIDPNSLDWYFGSRNSQPWWDGRLDEIRIWHAKRTQSQIQANMSKQLNGDEPGLVAYWRFNGDFKDSGPNGLDLTPQNGTPTFSGGTPF